MDKDVAHTPDCPVQPSDFVNSGGRSDVPLPEFTVYDDPPLLAFVPAPIPILSISGPIVGQGSYADFNFPPKKVTCSVAEGISVNELRSGIFYRSSSK